MYCIKRLNKDKIVWLNIKNHSKGNTTDLYIYSELMGSAAWTEGIDIGLHFLVFDVVMQ